ncbi:hypothetical protein EX30DRAFT_369045 [Ascodesmis nigricans]|uniref:GATA-type domain-containing protein n=1 Tax=Ascodesmis nigricans TaxID=341454 RepID=A0A4S2N3T5_9PEZI|nr:hypothetical protein EX30DRAFT_369045 [Ascodesmis nigricans]
MTFGTSPAASTATQGTNPPVCQNCTTSTTPLWRRDEAGSVLCNACGLFLKLHRRPRPHYLKSDVIKSRNRVKNSGANKKKSLFDNAPSVVPAPPSTSNGHHTPRSEPGTPPPQHSYPASSLHQYQTSRLPQARSVSPQSRSSTPTLPPPSAIFDPVLLLNHSPHITSTPRPQSRSPPPTLPALNLLTNPSPPQHYHPSHLSRHQRQQQQQRHTSAPAPSPPPSQPLHLEPTSSPSSSALLAENSKLKTRVAELELVNDLYRSKVTELDASEQNARRSEQVRKEVEEQLRKMLAEGRRREEDLRRRVEELEMRGSRRASPEDRDASEDERRRKRVRVTDLTA